jgi:hypothetical protein
MDTIQPGNNLWESFGNVMQNQLVRQFLASAGSAVGGPGSVGEALGGMVNKDIQGQNYNALLKKMLGPDGSKGTFDNTGLTLKIPNTDPMISQLLGGGQGQGGMSLMSPEVINSLNPTGQNPDAGLPTPQIGTTQTAGGRPSIANPFAIDQQGTSYPELNASDLAGLSPEMIASAFGLAQQAKSVPIENAYRQALTQQAIAQTENIPIQQQLELMKLQKEAALDQPFGIKGPGGMEVSLREWSSLPEKDRNYLVAKHGAEILGDTNFMSQREWEATAPTEQGRFLRDIMLHPAMKKVAMDLKRAGATTVNLNTKLEEKKAMGDLEGQLYFSDPKWTEDLGKHLNSEDVQNETFTSKTPGRVKAKATVKFIEDKITGGGGKIRDVKMDKDGRTMVWEVRWPSGDIKKLRYVVK